MRKTILLAMAGVLAAGGAGTAYAAGSGSAPRYRLATASPAQVTARLSETGTVTPVHQATLAFAVGGTVASVAVHAGQHVTAGHVLGALDPTSLRAALAQAQSALAGASLTVHDDLSRQATAVSGPPGPGSGPPASPSPARQQLLRAQRAVLVAQRTADADLAVASVAIAQATRSCVPPPPPPPSPPPSAPAPPSQAPPSPAPSHSARPLPSASSPAVHPTPPATRAPRPPVPPSPVPPSPVPPLSGPASSCLAAMQQAIRAETTALHADQALAVRLAALSKLLGQPSSLRTAASSASASPARLTAVRVVAAGPRRGGPGVGGAGGTAAGPVSAAQLAADQAAADAAAAQVTVAQADLDNATLRSPAGGTVVTVSVAAGASVSAGDAAFVVAGLDSFEVTADVPVTSLPQLRDGQRATVSADGGGPPVSGTVTSIGLQPDSTSSPATYPVTISLAGPVTDLHAGTLAAVTIITARGSGVTVPTSAVRYAGKKATVLVYAGGRATVTKVSVGTRGAVLTQVTAGLRAGQQVVLASLSAPLPAAQP